MIKLLNSEKDRLREVFEALGKNEYGLLWELVDDMAYNGHTIEVKSSHQFNHVVIDGVYRRIAPNNGKVMCSRTDMPDKAFTPLDYVMEVVLAEPRTEDKDARIMLDAGWERDKSFASEDEAEDYAWREYRNKDKRCSVTREFFDNEHGFGFYWTVWI